MSSTISELRKKPHTQSHAPLPVLLTIEYKANQVKRLIQCALNEDIKICTRVDIVSPNGIETSVDFRLTPEQIKQVWQSKPKIVCLKLKSPEHLAKYLPEIFEVEVGINGLLINKIEADILLASIESKNKSKENLHSNVNDENQIKEKIDNKKKQVRIKLKNDNNRPSESCRDKSQRITQEFEDIIISGALDFDSINLDTIWKTVLKQAEEGKSSRFKKDNNILIDKQTSDVWTSESAYKHKKKIMDWINTFKNK